MATEPTNRKRRIPIQGTFLLLCLCLHASAADRTIAQFVHKAWVAKDGAPANITAITQTTDGYLWLASSQGLYRFDGVEFERFEAGSRPSPLDSVWSLLACPNGDLWAGSAASGITLVRRGASRSYTKADGFPDSAVLSIARDRDGSIWAATKDGLLQFDGRSWARMGSESGIEGTPNSLYVDGRGTLWVTTVETIYFRSRGAQIFQQTGLHTAWVEQLVESPGGVMWMVQTTRSVRPMPPSAKDPEIMVGSQHVLFDRDGALWITTLGDGLRRLAHPDSLTHEKFDKSSDQLERFTADLGLSSDYADTIFQDREGNIWVGTSGGLDRFSKAAIIPGPIQTNRMTRFALAPDADGDVWLADLSAHVGRIHKGQWFPENGLTSFSASPDPKGGAWIATFDRVRHEVDGRFTDINFPQSLLPNPQPVRMAPDNLGALWVSGSFGVLVRRGGKWHTVDFPSGFPGKTPSLVYGDTAGRVWLGFKENAILLIDGNAQRSLSEKDGLHAGAILAISVRGGSTWVAGSNGLQLFDGQRFRDITPPEGGSFGNISGVLETSDGSLWLSAYNGIIRLAPPEVSKLKAGENHAESTRFDAYDGLPGPTQQAQPYPSLVQATDGTLWFATSAGPVWIDPNDIPHNALPPSVAIRSVTAHGKRYASFANLHLPKLTRDLDIAYTALSLTVPERVHFRYMLEGSDKDWRDGGTRRQASYTNLGPGPYRFRVIASNNDGVWNKAAADVTFRIDAAFYQTMWFQAFCYMAGTGFLWLFYRYQLHQTAAHVHSRMEGQIAERERIARELHDTLLQSFQGSLFEFQAARNLLSRRPEKAAHTLDDAICSAEAAIAEGRYAIQGLRSGSTDGRDLALLFSAVLRELSDTQAPNGTSPEFRVTVEGAQRALPLVLQDELYRIGREVLRNAFRHAEAKRIEVEIRYGADAFRLRIRDNGIGIDPKVLNAGARPGHWGLPGVRERAKLAGARLDFWGEAGAGTEVQIKVPAAVAYATPRGTDIFRFFRRKVTIHAD